MTAIKYSSKTLLSALTGCRVLGRSLLCTSYVCVGVFNENKYTAHLIPDGSGNNHVAINMTVTYKYTDNWYERSPSYV